MGNKQNERILRKYIRDGIKVIFSRKNQEYIRELKLRACIRDLILEVSAEDILVEATEKPEADPHHMTGINVLRELFKNTNLLQMLAQAYKSLTSNEDQRESFRAHVINAVQNTLVTMDTTEEAPGEATGELSEAVDVDVEKMIDADDGQDEDEEEEDPKEDFSIEGEDETGRNRAFQVYPKVEQSIMDYYSILSQDEDREVFLDYLLTNLKLYFDKWEEQLQNKIQEPGSGGYGEAQEELGEPGEAPAEEAAEEEIPEEEIPEEEIPAEEEAAL